MSIDTISNVDGSGEVPRYEPTVEDKLRFAQRYVEVGWHIFVVRPDKSPFRNCEKCHHKSEMYTYHRPEDCGHLLCHGFYAGTRDVNRVAEMFQRYPDGVLALRTGWPSGVLALDFESHTSDPALDTGLQVLDKWETYTNGTSLTSTLQSSSESGGIHLLYQLPSFSRLASHNRILPNTDLKADGGYVCLPPTGGRSWAAPGLPVEIPLDVATWLSNQKGAFRGGRGGGGGSGGHSGGYDFQTYWRDGCPDGVRDEFFNDLIFRLRKRGVDRTEAERITYDAWERCAQPPEAQWFMPWHHVEYKLDRIWVTVEVDVPSNVLMDWARAASKDRVVPTSKITIARRTK